MAALGGQLACYSPSKRLVAFASPGVVERVVVLVGGLTDGLLALPYVSRLSAGLEACGWSLVQPMLRSSLSGYGVQTLDDDVEDVDELVHWLTSRHRVRQVVLMGHSTGCQDAVHYMLRGAHKDKVAALVLQGPVSDREYMVSSDPATEHWHRMAQEMVERGDGTALLPREAHPVPITAHRFHSLTARMAQDDMFSSDLTDDELRQRLGHVGVPALLAFSGEDEYVPLSVDKRELLDRMVAALPQGQALLLEGATHGVAEEAGMGELVEAVTRFCASAS